MKIVVWGQELTAWVISGALAEVGNQVFIVDDSKNQNPIRLLEKRIHNEPGLKDLISAVIEQGNLQLIPRDSALSFETHILSLNANDFDIAKDIVNSIATVKDHRRLIINQSHFGIGYTDKLQALLNHDNEQVIVYFAENISEGEALHRVQKPRSMTLGSASEWATETVTALFKPFTNNLEDFFVVTPKEAEFAKLSIMGMLALRIGYINELANLAELLDVDINVIRQCMGADPRVGKHHLAPGCGFGGNSFPQIIDNLAHLLVEKRESQLLDTVLKENEIQKEQPFRKLWRHYQCDISDLKIVIWGASYKPGSSALDSAPSLKNIEAIVSQQANVYIHDPEALENINQKFSDNPMVKTIDDKYKALKNADALLILTEWPEYRNADLNIMFQAMKNPVIVDGRNIFDRKQLENQGFVYYCIGR